MDGGYTPRGRKELDTTERLLFHCLVKVGPVVAEPVSKLNADIWRQTIQEN